MLAAKDQTPLPETRIRVADFRLPINTGACSPLTTTWHWGSSFFSCEKPSTYSDNRYYSSTYGRFTSPDPYRASGGPADPGSWNRYAYVQNDPVNNIDPQGLSLMRAGDYSFVIDGFEMLSGGGGLSGGGAWGGGGVWIGGPLFLMPWGLFDIPSPPVGPAPNMPDPFCGINPVSGFSGFTASPKGEPGHLRPGVGGGGAFGDPRNGGRVHQGIDISGKSGESTIWASLSGTVTSVGNERGYGLTVRVDVGYGYSQLYAHLNSVDSDIFKGAKVSLGQILGVMGQTGNAEGQAASEAHLHFEVRNSGRAVNPASFLNSPCPWTVP